MPDYLLHKRGRGRLYGDAEANAATLIDKTSSAASYARLRDCRLLGYSEVTSNAQVYGGTFHASIVGGRTVVAGNPDVFDSVIHCSEVSGTPWISHARLLGLTEVCDSPKLYGHPDSPLTLDNAIIYGSPTIAGSFTVTGRVHEGTWTRAPKHIKLPWCDLSECMDGKVLLDCRCRTVEYWMRHGAKLARRWEWSEDQISVTLSTIEREFVVHVSRDPGEMPDTMLAVHS